MHAINLTNDDLNPQSNHTPFLILKEGYLGHRNCKLKLRWTVLTRRYLKTYKQKRDHDPAEVFDLLQFGTTECHFDSITALFSFNLISTANLNKQTFLARDKGSRDDWIAKIRQAQCLLKRYTPKVKPSTKSTDDKGWKCILCTSKNVSKRNACNVCSAPCPLNQFTPPPWVVKPTLKNCGLKVMERSKLISTITQVAKKPYVLFGRLKAMNDIILGHPSISRRHALVGHGASGSIYVMDLGSSFGTFVNAQRLKTRQRQPLRAGYKIKFGECETEYIVKFDLRKRQGAIEILTQCNKNAICEPPKKKRKPNPKVTRNNALVVCIGIGKYNKGKNLNTANDISMYQSVFKKFGYKVIANDPSQPMNKEEMERFLRKARNTHLYDFADGRLNYDALILTFGGHGTSDSVVCSDGSRFKHKAMREIFFIDELKDIPKIFLIDACRTDNVDKTKTEKARNSFTAST
eukprot:633980_1